MRSLQRCRSRRQSRTRAGGVTGRPRGHRWWGLHAIKLLPDGTLIRCSGICTKLRAFYRELLTGPERSQEVARLAQRLDDLTRLARSSNRRIAERAAEQAAALEPELRTHASRLLGKSLGVADDVAEPFLRLHPMARVRSMEPLLLQLNRKSPEVRAMFRRAMELGDDATRTDLIAVLRRNAPDSPGSLSNAVFEDVVRDTAALLERYGDRVGGNLASRYAATYGRDAAQATRARGELDLIEDVLEGRSPYGSDARVRGLAESTVEGQQMPEISIARADGSTPQLAEVKTIGVPEIGSATRPLGEEPIKRNLREALSQIRARAGEGQTQALVRLDGRHAGPLAMTERSLRGLVLGRLLEGDHVSRVRWIEIIYNDARGRQQRALYELVGRRLVRSGT